MISHEDSGSLYTVFWCLNVISVKCHFFLLTVIFSHLEPVLLDHFLHNQFHQKVATLQ